MGLDFVELTMAIEGEFHISLSHEDTSNFFEQKSIRSQQKWWIFSRETHDFRVQDFIDWVTQAIREQRPDQEIDVFKRMKKHIAEIAACEDSKVIPDALMNADLGLL